MMLYHIIMIIIIIVLMSVFHVFIGWTVSCQWIPSIFVFSWVLVDFPFFQIISYYLIRCISMLYQGKPALTLNALHTPHQTLSSILYTILKRCKHYVINHSFYKNMSTYSCKHSLVWFKILFSGLEFLIHLIIPVLFLSRLITSSSLTDWVSLQYGVTLRKHVECNLSFTL